MFLFQISELADIPVENVEFAQVSFLLSYQQFDPCLSHQIVKHIVKT